MTDRRIAALAAALAEAQCRTVADDYGYEAAAAAILAALPDDWCGHAASPDLIWVRQEQLAEDAAEIARLRAALKEIAYTPWASVKDAAGTARDALEEKP